MSDLDLMFAKLVKAYGVAGSAMLFALTGFAGGCWLVASAWLTVQGQQGINETKIRLYEAELRRLRLTAAEREAIEQAIDAANGMILAEPWAIESLRKLLERLK
jgi:hypothetical protein